ncbi:MAG TPA: hypothetical protein VMU95_33515 [Trebonia sp.]|nr:hypothetical protein [Trebonia sp.]
MLVAESPARVGEAAARDMALRAVLDRHRMRLRTDQRYPASLWIDTGPVWLFTPQGRASVLASLAEAVSALAAAVGRHGGLLMPSAARAAYRDRWSWLCEDRHCVEVVNERQREVVTNLLRRWVPELIAASGRAAFGTRTADRYGSRRLADVGDQVPARYIASASKLHLDRVREALRRDEGVSGLDVMDINPLGDDSVGMPNVNARCIDAQAFPATFISHAMLLQALAMKARRTEKDGGRIGAYPQDMLDRNRSRAVASGLSARLEVELGRGSRGPGGRGPDEARDKADVVLRTAADQVESLIREVLPELRAMEVTGAELMPLVGGLSLRDHYPDAVRTENDLFAAWRRAGSDRLDGRALHELLSSREALAIDQLTRANEQLTPGGAAVVEDFWTGLLQRPEKRRPEERRPEQRRPEERRRPARPRRDSSASSKAPPSSEPADDRRNLADATLLAALREADARDAAVAAVRRHAAAGWRSIVPALKQVETEDAKQMRRALRPPGGDVLRLRDSTDIGGQLGKTIMDTVFQRGDAFVALDIAASDRAAGLAAVDTFRKTLPSDIATVLITNTQYPHQGDKRVSLEVLVVNTRGLGS